ncbi:hypothetical protein EDB92DRAFT_1952297 [Lactarius akahatsu]|uniref:Uncharacterized protein n=1 Tax=Lactarius akahatsu TaxID=416441 RepID=A0AAD4L6I9_9AGAM|nr:hypothetical protein EDB92DRAFT_1952297 [Lactarius akahatsu]
MSQDSTPGPSSPSSRSFLDASSAIDDLTHSLTDYSRVSTPEPPSHASGCNCNTDDSEYTKAWMAVKTKLENRLVLSAEVGQALLRRHETYVRRMQAAEHVNELESLDGESSDLDPTSRQQMEDRIAELSKENAVLHKVHLLDPALLNNEHAEASNKSLSADLQEMRDSFSHLSAEHARSVGWEPRLHKAMQERDDFHQERDDATQKLRAAEAKSISLGDKCEVRHLREQLKEERAKRGQASEDMLSEAKQWLTELQHSRVNMTSMEQHDEVTKLLESLVADKEALEKSNAELQELLSESREALDALQEEAGERLVSSPGGGRISSPLSSTRPHNIPRAPSPSSSMTYGTAPGPLSPISAIFSDHEKTSAGRRSFSIESPSRRSFVYAPLTPETSRRAISPRSSQARRTRLLERDSGINIALEAGSTSDESDAEDTTPGRPIKQKPLYLLQCHRGVQTDPQGCAGTLSPGQRSHGDQMSLSTSPNEEHSESSSLVDNPSTLGSLLERVQYLFNKIAQADARTLTTRLKRQNILGADVSHLSHSTVDGIVAEAANLRGIFRTVLEDEKFTTICTRRDLRTLLKLAKDIFKELGVLRTTLNDIVLDPSIAPKVREMTLDPKDEFVNGKSSTSNSGGGWMAPLTKLFTGATFGEPKRALSPLDRGRGLARPSSRPIPKLGPATSASTTIVNVEFTGTGAGRAITSATSPITQEVTRDAIATPTPARSTSLNLMGIFAGAPRIDPWIVLPSGPPKQPGAGTDQLRRATLGRAAGRAIAAADNSHNPLPRNVDAVIDPHGSPEDRRGFDPSRTLRTRGLSDSSIRSTFLQHGEAAAAAGPSEASSRGMTIRGALGQTVRGTRLAMSPEQTASSSGSAKEVSSHFRQAPRFGRLLPDISSWAASAGTDVPDPDAYVGSVMSNAPLRPWSREGRQV